MGGPLSAMRCTDEERQGPIYAEIERMKAGALSRCERHLNKQLARELGPPQAELDACREAFAAMGWRAAFATMQVPSACSWLREAVQPRGKVLGHAPWPTLWARWAPGDPAGRSRNPGLAWQRRSPWVDDARITLRQPPAKEEAELTADLIRFFEGCAKRHPPRRGPWSWRIVASADEIRFLPDPPASAAPDVAFERCAQKSLAHPRHEEARREGFDLTLSFDVDPGHRAGPTIPHPTRPVAADEVPVHSRGTPLPVLMEGDPCTWRIGCSAPLVCRVGRCAAPGKEGEPCSGTAECDAGLWCAPQTEGAHPRYDVAGHCAPPRPTNGSCTHHAQCEGACSPEGRCVAFCGSG